MVTTAYPVKLEIQDTHNQSIKYIKESLRAIPNKGLGYGAFKEASQTQILKDLPLISFNQVGLIPRPSGS